MARASNFVVPAPALHLANHCWAARRFCGILFRPSAFEMDVSSSKRTFKEKIVRRGLAVREFLILLEIWADTSDVYHCIAWIRNHPKFTLTRRQADQDRETYFRHFANDVWNDAACGQELIRRIVHPALRTFIPDLRIWRWGDQSDHPDLDLSDPKLPTTCFLFRIHGWSHEPTAKMMARKPGKGSSFKIEVAKSNSTERPGLESPPAPTTKTTSYH